MPNADRLRRKRPQQVHWIKIGSGVSVFGTNYEEHSDDDDVNQDISLSQPDHVHSSFVWKPVLQQGKSVIVVEMCLAETFP